MKLNSLETGFMPFELQFRQVLFKDPYKSAMDLK
jgi:hypothetical protein